MSHSQYEPIPEEALKREHEQRDLSIRGIMISLTLLTVFTAFFVVAMAGMLGWLNTSADAADPAPSPVGAAEKIPPQPRLETLDGSVLQTLHESENYLLDGYGWVDRDAGAARIPLDRAMEIIGREGLPHRSGAPATGSAPEMP